MHGAGVREVSASELVGEKSVMSPRRIQSQRRIVPPTLYGVHSTFFPTLDRYASSAVHQPLTTKWS